jgi:hypothetical protein
MLCYTSNLLCTVRLTVFCMHGRAAAVTLSSAAAAVAVAAAAVRTAAVAAVAAVVQAQSLSHTATERLLQSL